MDANTLLLLNGDDPVTWGVICRDNELTPDEMAVIECDLIERGEHIIGGGTTFEVVITFA